MKNKMLTRGDPTYNALLLVNENKILRTYVEHKHTFTYVHIFRVCLYPNITHIKI